MPVIVHNNTEGDADDEVRQRFDEPSWNNPVVRFLDPRADGSDLRPRLERPWTRLALADAMAGALAAAGRELPPPLRLLRREERAHARGVEVAIFGMA